MSEREAASREPRHPIRAVARRTGISLHLLRAWERRYAVVEPVRTASGQRLYSDADIVRLTRLRDAVAAGWSISQAASLSDAELEGLVRDAAVSAAPSPPLASPPAEIEGFLRECLEAAAKMQEDVLHRLLMRAVVSLRPIDFIEGLVAPLLHQVGERWHEGELRPSHEHAVSIAVRRVLTFLLSAYEPVPGAPTLVTTTVSGDPHEFGSMLASVLAAEAGWRVLYLGPSLPAEDIARAADVTGAAAVAVSAVDDRGRELLVTELSALRTHLPEHVRLFAGGRVAHQYGDDLAEVEGLELVSLRELRDVLPAGAAVTA